MGSGRPMLDITPTVPFQIGILSLLSKVELVGSGQVPFRGRSRPRWRLEDSHRKLTYFLSVGGSTAARSTPKKASTKNRKSLFMVVLRRKFGFLFGRKAARGSVVTRDGQGKHKMCGPTFEIFNVGKRETKADFVCQASSSFREPSCPCQDITRPSGPKIMDINAGLKKVLLWEVRKGAGRTCYGIRRAAALDSGLLHGCRAIGNAGPTIHNEIYFVLSCESRCCCVSLSCSRDKRTRVFILSSIVGVVL